MIKLSKAEAQRIQAEHIEWYGRTYGFERVRGVGHGGRPKPSSHRWRA